MNKTNTSPIIGVTMSFDADGMIRDGVDYSFIRRDYGEALQAAGAQPIFLDMSIDPQVAAKLCDGIVISGGQDIDPALYGEKVTGAKYIEPRARSEWERLLIDACDEREVPILGICYGQQLLNVHYGGTLYQDIASEFENALDHGTSGEATIHEVTFVQDGLGFKKGDSASSASRHHQAVKDIAEGFTAVATASDGIIESIKGRGHYGIQWHPESDGTAARIYNAFVDMCVSSEPVTLTDMLPEPLLG